MNVRTFALIYGIVFLLVGILGFVPGINQPPPANHGLHVTDPGHGMLLGLFHVNVLHNAVHLLFGVWGLIAYRSFPGARMYACLLYTSRAHETPEHLVCRLLLE